MKQVIKIIALVFIAATTFYSCKKYSEGPSLSLRSKAERVANTWEPESVTFNGTDITNVYTSIAYTETYTKEGGYSYNTSSGGGSGKWNFQNNEAEIKRNGVSGQSSVDMVILRLKEKSFWFKFTDGGDIYEFHMIPN